MFRVLKLLALGLLGYSIFEFIRGMTTASSPQRSGERASSKLINDSPSNITGPGEGVPVETQNADGGMSTVRVGRGAGI